MVDLGATSNALSSVKGLVESGPVSAIGGIFSDITDGITNGIKSIEAGFESLL